MILFAFAMHLHNVDIRGGHDVHANRHFVKKNSKNGLFLGPALQFALAGGHEELWKDRMVHQSGQGHIYLRRDNGQ